MNGQSSIDGLLGAGLPTPPTARPKVSVRPTRHSKSDAPLFRSPIRFDDCSHRGRKHLQLLPSSFFAIASASRIALNATVGSPLALISMPIGSR